MLSVQRARGQESRVRLLPAGRRRFRLRRYFALCSNPTIMHLQLANIPPLLGRAVISASCSLRKGTKSFDWNFFGGNFRVQIAAHCLHDCVKNRPNRGRTHSWLRGGGEKWKPAEEEKVYLEATALFLPLSAWPHFLITCKLTPEE